MWLHIKSSKIIEQYRKLPAGVKASIWFTICSIFQKGIQLFTVPLFTRILTTEQYGQFNLYQSWLNLLMMIGSLYLFNGVFNNGMLRYESQRTRYTAAMQGLSTTSTAILFIIYIMGYRWFDELFGLPHIVMLGIFTEILLTPALSYWTMRQRFEYKYKLLVLITLGTSILNPLLGFAAVACTEEKGVGRILSVVLVNACVGLIFYIYNFYKGKTFFVKEYWLFALKFNLPLIPHYLSNVILAQSDRIMIEKMFGTSPVAIYSVAYAIGMVMNLITSSVNASFVPWTYQTCKKGDFGRIGKMANILLVFMAAITLVPILVAPEIITVMGPAEYAPAAWVVPPVAIAGYLIFVYSLFGNIEFYYAETKFVMVASCIAAASNVVLNLLFMPHFGYVAAGYTTVACYLIMALAHYLFMRQVLRKHQVESGVYNVKAIVAVSAALAVVSAVFMGLYSYPLIRYGILVVVLVAAIVRRNQIIEVLRQLKNKNQEETK